MSARPRLAEQAATLLDADPGLGRAIGHRNASALGARRLLPVLSVEPGAWVPPPPASLGPGTIALVVLDGLLVRTPELLVGPRGVIEPWGAAWVACTPARLAVIGDAYLDALRLWPETAARIRSGASAPAAVVTPAIGTVEERLLELLWRVALRWGQPRGPGLSLPGVLDATALSLMLAVPESELAPALARLRTDGLGATREGALWLPAGREPLTGATARRDELRTRAALQLALSRAVWDECSALFDALDLAVRRRDELRKR